MPRLTAIEIKKMRVEILTEAFSQTEIANHFGVNRQTVHRHKKVLDDRPDIRAKFQKELNKIMIERDAKRDRERDREKLQKQLNKILIDPKRDREKLQTSRKCDIDALQEVNEEIENVTVSHAANLVADVIESHRQITQDAMIGVKRIQASINAQAETENPDVLRGLAQAQRQNSSSIVNIINCDRRSYNIDDPGAGDDAPDAVNITFYREQAPKQIEDVG